MDGIKGLFSLPYHSVDMILTDPPYGTTRNFWDVPLPLPELWEAVRWALKPDGAALFFAQCPYDKLLGASNLPMLRYEWVWCKSRATGFLNANRAPMARPLFNNFSLLFWVIGMPASFKTVSYTHLFYAVPGGDARFYFVCWDLRCGLFCSWDPFWQ